jgi:hypothetical protein
MFILGFDPSGDESYRQEEMSDVLREIENDDNPEDRLRTILRGMSGLISRLPEEKEVEITKVLVARFRASLEDLPRPSHMVHPPFQLVDEGNLTPPQSCQLTHFTDLIANLKTIFNTTQLRQLWQSQKHHMKSVIRDPTGGFEELDAVAIDGEEVLRHSEQMVTKAKNSEQIMRVLTWHFESSKEVYDCSVERLHWYAFGNDTGPWDKNEIDLDGNDERVLRRPQVRETAMRQAYKAEAGQASL